jgi:hypothetical protein
LRRNIEHLVLGAFLAGVSPGCVQAEFGELEVEMQSSPPLTVDVRNSGVTLPVGIAVRLKVKPVSKSTQRYTSNDELEFESNNPSVMESFQFEDTSQVVLTGGRIGETCLRVLVNQRQVECLPVSVVEQ